MSKHSDTKKAEKKAKDWYQDPALVTKPEKVSYKAPTALVDIGCIVAIEYSSDKFDGTTRTYRHDVTKIRRLFLSPDGSTMVIDPPFKITKRGIEG